MLLESTRGGGGGHGGTGGLLAQLPRPARRKQVGCVEVTGAGVPVHGVLVGQGLLLVKA